MTDISILLEAWNKQQNLMEKNISLNLELLKRINVKSAQSKMIPLVWINAITLLFYQLCLWYCVHFTINHWNERAFVLAGAVLIIWSAIISIGAIKQLKLILEIDYSRPVTEVQKQLQKVKFTVIHFIRMAFMILPFYIVFPIVIFEVLFEVNFIAHTSNWWLILQSIILIPPTIWIYKNFSPKNANKKWINWILQGNGSQINDAQHFLQEIEDFKAN